MNTETSQDILPMSLDSYSTCADIPRLPAVELLRTMVESREGDRREAILMRQGKGWFQVHGLGHEALAAIVYALQPHDYIFPYYRDRPLTVARGIDTRQHARDYLARADSSSGGRHMPGHCSSRTRNVFSVATPTGMQCLPAVGAAWAIKREGSDAIVLCTIGDGATRQGEFYEALCFAVQENLPIVFLIEDNAYGISTPTAHLLPFRLGIFHQELTVRINGRDAFEVYSKGSHAVSQARNGLGPTILWCEVDRMGSHTSSDDHRVYRLEQELEEMLQRDPVRLLAERLFDTGELTPDAFDIMQKEISRDVDRIYREVEQTAGPDPARVLEHLYGPPVAHTPVPFAPEAANETMVAAVNRVLQAALETDPKVLLFGEDIEDPKGGVFGFTKGLSTRFPGRVLNSPLAEATIVGTAVGLAAAGHRPVFELQFIDFIAPGFNQIATQVSNLRWRTLSDWTCPMVLYAPYGAYLPAGGMWHSQSNDGWWAHLPGLRVAIPSTPEDAVGLFWSAMQDQDPSLILIPKHLFRVRMPVSAYAPIPFGAARLRREGSDVTLVTWGNCTELADQAAARLADEGVSAEVLDLRTLVPCDWKAVETSVAKTERLVVIHEAQRTCGFGAAVVAEIATHPDRFYSLVAPPQLVARPDVHVPFCPSLEYAMLPDLERVLKAVHTTLE